MQKDKNTKKKIKRTISQDKNTVRQKDKNTKRQNDGLRWILVVGDDKWEGQNFDS